MAQQRPRDLRSGGGESLKHIGAQFGSHDVLADRDYNIERDRNLHGALINDTGRSRDFPSAKKPDSSGSGWTVVKRQPTVAEDPSTTHRGGRTSAAAIDSANNVTPMQRLRSETANAQPWHGLGHVSEERNTTTRVSEAGQRIETFSLGTCKGSIDTTWASSKD
jgi:hypothetical protein